MYTIGQIAKISNLPISTLRYYDKEGLFPDLRRISGIRQFSEKELDTLRIIECLKKSGLEIKDIKDYMHWSRQGEATLLQRRDLFEQQKINVNEAIEKLKKVQDMIEYKCWYYNEAIRLGNENSVKDMIPDQMPNSIQKCYINSRS